MVNKKPIDWDELLYGLDIICNPEESLETRQGASKLFLEYTETITWGRMEEVRHCLYCFAHFGDGLNPEFIRSEFTQICADYATNAVEMNRRENAKKGGRKPSFDHEVMLKEYEQWKAKNPKLTDYRLSIILSEEHKVNDRTVRRIIADFKDKQKK